MILYSFNIHQAPTGNKEELLLRPRVLGMYSWVWIQALMLSSCGTWNDLKSNSISSSVERDSHSTHLTNSVWGFGEMHTELGTVTISRVSTWSPTGNVERKWSSCCVPALMPTSRAPGVVQGSIRKPAAPPQPDPARLALEAASSWLTAIQGPALTLSFPWSLLLNDDFYRGAKLKFSWSTNAFLWSVQYHFSTVKCTGLDDQEAPGGCGQESRLQAEVTVQLPSNMPL